MKACQRLALRKIQTYIEVISSDVGENPVTVSVASSIVPVSILKNWQERMKVVSPVHMHVCQKEMR